MREKKLKLFECFKGTDKQQQILEAFMKLATENSNLAEISVKRIADQAGIGKGTVYEYFKSKDEIIQEAVSIIINGMFEVYLVDNYEGLDYEQSLKQYIENCSNASRTIGEYSKYNSYTIRETFKYVQSKEFLHDKILKLALQMIDIFVNKVVSKGVEEGTVDPEFDHVNAGIIAKLIIRDVMENQEFKFLDNDELNDRLYSIAYKQMKKEL